MKEQLDLILNVTNKELDDLDTRFVGQYNFFHDTEYFHRRSGVEHYRLLMYVSKLFKKQILLDVGTNRCMSAAALSYAMKNRVKSYDIVKINPVNPLLPYVEYIIGDVTKDNIIPQSPFIFLDVDHNGLFENVFYDYLHEIEWKGLLMLDDLNASVEMKTFWDRIEEEKYDITKIGHWSGTGIVYFK